MLQMTGVQVNNKGRVTDKIEPINSIGVTHMGTEKVHRFTTMRRDILVGALPPGEYCLTSFRSYVGRYDYPCQEPTFTVIANAVANLGRWTMGIQTYPPHGYGLLASHEQQPETAALANDRFTDRIASFISQTATDEPAGAWYGVDGAGNWLLLMLDSAGQARLFPKFHSQPIQGRWTMDDKVLELELEAAGRWRGTATDKLLLTSDDGQQLNFDRHPIVQVEQ